MASCVLVMLNTLYAHPLAVSSGGGLIHCPPVPWSLPSHTAGLEDGFKSED